MRSMHSMSETWLHDYILLAFRIHRLVQKAYECPFVEEYYGPPEMAILKWNPSQELKLLRSSCIKQ